jgi:PAS domain S-box-containing protein
MRLSLQAKISILIAVIFFLSSGVSTYLFTAAHSRSKENGRVLRGMALVHSLSKSAEDGLINEDLDLIKKASYVIKAPDVTLAQVYSDIWEPVDAYPFKKLKELPAPDAVNHFRNDASSFYIKNKDSYDFYSPVFYSASGEAAPVTIGFVRIVVSSADVQKELRVIVLNNIVLSLLITLIAIFSINTLLSRIVIRPVLDLHKSVSRFKEGALPDAVAVRAADEIGELSMEFNRMSRSIQERNDKLVESEERIKSLFERVEHAIFGLDREGNIIEANSKFTEMFGTVKNICNLLTSEKKAQECLYNSISNKVVHAEEHVMGKYGNELIVLLSMYPEIGFNGDIEGYDGYIIDITEKKRLEERLIRSQKMEAVGTLVGGMAHEFNNLLTAILGYSEIMLSMITEGDQYYKPVNIIHEAAKRGADFGRKILTITRKEKIETKPVNINDIINNSIDLLQRSIPKNIEIVVKLSNDIPAINADPSQIQQVIVNLAINARDAMPDGGKLFIETSAISAEDDVPGDMGAVRQGFIKLSVADTGTGIDVETQSKIFDPFFTTKEVGKGTGLGLYMVHSIINNHGGYINLYSEPLKGTQFNIYLPVSRLTEPEEANDIRSVKGTGTILVIDDEADVRELCKDLLKTLGYSVLPADSGSAGIRIYRERKDEIALVILDMIMPKMGGREVFQTLKMINPEVKVLLCSGFSQNGFAGIEELLRKGAVEFVQKPFSRQAIGLAIKKALEA